MKSSTKWIAGTTAAAAVVIALAVLTYRTPSDLALESEKEAASVTSADAQRAAVRRVRLAEENAESQSASGDPLQTMTFEEIKSAAVHGSVIAQRQLADIYAMCGPYSLNPSVALATLDHLSSLSPGSKKGMDQVKKRLVSRCDQVEGGQFIPMEAWRLWMQQAAKNGDIASLVKLRMHSSGPLSGKEASALADAALASGDPQAMLEMSNLISRPITDELPDRYSQVAGDPLAGTAWGIAACRAGAACGNGSMLMDSVCMSTGRCSYPSYEAFLMNEMVPPGERARLSAMLSNITALRRP